jgi:hypothetical protein
LAAFGAHPQFNRFLAALRYLGHSEVPVGIRRLGSSGCGRLEIAAREYVEK